MTSISRNLTLIPALLAVSICGGAQAWAVGGPEASTIGSDPLRGSAVPGEVIVRFVPGSTPEDRRDARLAAHVSFEKSLALPRAQLVEADGVSAAIRRLNEQPEVAYAQPNYRYRSLAAEPDDTFFEFLWGLGDTPAPNPGVNALPAWDSTRGSGQVIAVVDTGVALDHPDLALWDGGPGGTHGYDFVDGDTEPDDFQYHGTHVAGTAAATADNGLGTAGVAPDAEIMAIRVLDAEGAGSTDDVAAGIVFAATNGADVINLSLGAPAAEEGDQVLQDAVAMADALDVVVVAAAGNDGSDNDVQGTLPCTLPNPNLICVAALRESGDLADFSNFGGDTVDVAAPGTNILSAETDYDPVFQNGLDSPSGWVTDTSNGGVPWGLVSSPRTEGSGAATDSPDGVYGHAIDPEAYAESTLTRTSGIDLSAERGCRMRFDLRTDLEPYYDYLGAGVSDGPVDENVESYFGDSSNGAFYEEEFSIADFDGLDDVRPRFTLFSDPLVEMDGVYLDDLRVLCRADTYSDASLPIGNYVAFDGTSMATPHVAGVAALLGAFDPSASDTKIVQAIEAGTLPVSSLSCRVVTGGAVDAAAAIATLSSGTPVSSRCTPPPPAPSAPLARRAARPSKPDLSRSPRAVRVSKRGVLRYSFRATPGLTGNATFRTRVKAVVSRRAHVTIGSRSFTVSSTGRVTVKVKLSKKKLRILRRNRKLLLNATVVVRNAASLTSSAKKRLTLKPPRR
jgi:thermitase